MITILLASLSVSAFANDDHAKKNKQFNPHLGDGRGKKYESHCADYLTKDQCLYFADGYYSGRRDAKKGREHDPKEHDGAHGYMKEIWVNGYDKGFKDHH